MWNRCQVAIEYVNRDRRENGDRTNPKAQVTMHTLPAGVGLAFAAIATITFSDALASRHLSLFDACKGLFSFRNWDKESAFFLMPTDGLASVSSMPNS
jgi:hypothetical protein